MSSIIRLRNGVISGSPLEIEARTLPGTRGGNRPTTPAAIVPPLRRSRSVQLAPCAICSKLLFAFCVMLHVRPSLSDSHAEEVGAIRLANITIVVIVHNDIELGAVVRLLVVGIVLVAHTPGTTIGSCLHAHI